jgi:hypothetical protein
MLSKEAKENNKTINGKTKKNGKIIKNKNK